MRLKLGQSLAREAGKAVSNRSILAEVRDRETFLNQKKVEKNAKKIRTGRPRSKTIKDRAGKEETGSPSYFRTMNPGTGRQRYLIMNKCEDYGRCYD